mmetsp:Transcript_8329/g.21483  ORF Transcript_8329/g.21483 Transcript_8329/m.21483 type:complete len:321 (-) Transcript_8329:338-1300(-)
MVGPTTWNGRSTMEMMYQAASVSESSVGSSTSSAAGVVGEEMDAKKRAKREANRRSAQLSRARKKAFIEDLKQKNHEYQRCEQILACHPDLVFAFDAAGRIEFANARACSQLDLSARDLEAQSFFEMLGGESRLRFQSALQEVMSRPGQCRASLRFDRPLEMKTKKRPLNLDVIAQCTRDDTESGQWFIVCAARPGSRDDDQLECGPRRDNVFPGGTSSSTMTKDDDLLDDDSVDLPPSPKKHRGASSSSDDSKQPLNVFALVAAAANLEPLTAPGPRVGALAAADAQNKKRAREHDATAPRRHSLSSLSLAALSAGMAL